MTDRTKQHLAAIGQRCDRIRMDWLKPSPTYAGMPRQQRALATEYPLLQYVLSASDVEMSSWTTPLGASVEGREGAVGEAQALAQRRAPSTTARMAKDRITRRSSSGERHHGLFR